MWSYYGSKSSLVDRYPKPKHDKIYEPFAGAAKYCLKYWDKEITLVDKYDVIVDIWRFLQQCSKKDILSLPRFQVGELYDNHKFDCIEQRNLISFIHGCGDAKPRNKPTKRKTENRPNHVNFTLNKIANDLHKIKHWNIIKGDYDVLENTKATWFIDPPYEFGGDHYFCSNKNFDYKKLANWCKERIGQSIVCENTKATWLDFKPMIMNKGTNKKTIEAIWSNEKTAFDFEQQKIFI